MITRWLHLTRSQLPAMAHIHHWPISRDHCFMRVCLDAAFHRPWHEAIPRPAVRHATDADLRRAIAVAQSIVDAPKTLPDLNRQSLLLRGKSGPKRLR